MDYQFLHRIVKNEDNWLLVVGLTGFVFGGLIIFIFSILGLTFATLVAAAIAAPFAAYYLRRYEAFVIGNINCLFAY